MQSKESKPDGKELQYRPLTYFASDDQVQEILRRIKGEQRRIIARWLVSEGYSEGLDGSFFDEFLDAERRRAFASIHPHLMGGESLPDLQVGGAEIARISLRSTTADFISIRARPRGANR